MSSLNRERFAGDAGPRRPALVAAAADLDGIQEVIRRQDRIRQDHFEVAINELAASAVEILVNVYFEVADRHQELAARDALILDILRLAEELNVELAYPTQTIHVVNPHDGGDQPESTGRT